MIDHCFTNQTPNEGMRFDFQTHFQASKCRISRLSCNFWLFLSHVSKLCPKCQLKTVFSLLFFNPYWLTQKKDPERGNLSSFHAKKRPHSRVFLVDHSINKNYMECYPPREIVTLDNSLNAYLFLAASEEATIGVETRSRERLLRMVPIFNVKW